MVATGRGLSTAWFRATRGATSLKMTETKTGAECLPHRTTLFFPKREGIGGRFSICKVPCQ